MLAPARTAAAHRLQDRTRFAARPSGIAHNDVPTLKIPARHGTLAGALDANLAALIALQALDSAADTARRRLAELPAAEQALAARQADATAAVEAGKARLAENNTVRRQLEKDVASVDVRLARFDDHKAAVKTNQEYTA